LLAWFTHGFHQNCISKLKKVEKYLGRQADREKLMTNQQKPSRREIEELL
jgi:hypothetical protein